MRTIPKNERNKTGRIQKIPYHTVIVFFSKCVEPILVMSSKKEKEAA